MQNFVKESSKRNAFTVFAVIGLFIFLAGCAKYKSEPLDDFTTHPAKNTQEVDYSD